MDRRTAFGTLCAVIAGGGVATVIGAVSLPAHYPYFELLLYGGATAGVAGVLGLIGLFIFPPKKVELPYTPASTTIRSRGGGNIQVDEVRSSADTLVDVEEIENLAIKRGVHHPVRPPTRRSADKNGNS